MDEKAMKSKARLIAEKKIKKQMRKKLAEATNDLEDFYLKEVENFYSEYTPINYRDEKTTHGYWRHPFSAIEESGMARTYHKIHGEYELNEDKYIMYSGLALNTFRMYRDYVASTRYGHTDWVLWSFTQGYHGLPEPYNYAPRSNLRPIKDARKYIKDIILPGLNKKIEI